MMLLDETFESITELGCFFCGGHTTQKNENCIDICAQNEIFTIKDWSLALDKLDDE